MRRIDSLPQLSNLNIPPRTKSLPQPPPPPPAPVPGATAVVPRHSDSVHGFTGRPSSDRAQTPVSFQSTTRGVAKLSGEDRAQAL